MKIINVGCLKLYKRFNSTVMYNVVWKLTNNLKTLCIELLCHATNTIIETFYINLSKLRSSCGDFLISLNNILLEKLDTFVTEDEREGSFSVELTNILNSSESKYSAGEDAWFKYLYTKEGFKLIQSSSTSSSSFNNTKEIIDTVLSNVIGLSDVKNLFSIEFEQDNPLVMPDYFRIITTNGDIVHRRRILYTKDGLKVTPSNISIEADLVDYNGYICISSWENVMHYIYTKLTGVNSEFNHYKYRLINDCVEFYNNIKGISQINNKSQYYTAALFDQLVKLNKDIIAISD